MIKSLDKYHHYFNLPILVTSLFFSWLIHFIQPSPPTVAKLKSLHLVLRGQLPPQKWSHPLVACPPLRTSKSPQPICQYILPSTANMTTIIRQNTKFHPNARSPRQTWSPGYSLPDNFGPLSRGSVTNPILITVFDTHLTLRSLGAWVWAKILPILNVAP